MNSIFLIKYGFLTAMFWVCFSGSTFGHTKGVDADLDIESQSLRRLIRISEMCMERIGGRLKRLLGDHEEVLGEYAGGKSVIRVWVFGESGDGLYVIEETKKEQKVEIRVIRKLGENDYKEEKLEDVKIFSDRVAPMMAETLSDPLPLLSDGPRGKWGEEVCIIESYDNGNYKWAVRSLNLIGEENYFKFSAWMRILETAKWSPID